MACYGHLFLKLLDLSIMPTYFLSVPPELRLLISSATPVLILAGYTH